MFSESPIKLEINQLQFQWKDNQELTPTNTIFNFKVRQNEITGISAPSGFGKSTLLNHILNKYQETTLPYLVHGSIILNTANIGYLPQFAQEALHPTFTIAKQIKAFQTNLNLTPATDEEIEQLLIHLGFEDPSATLGKTANEMSGGQRQRICLLLSLLKKPDFLVLDEPTAALDKTNTLLLFNFLKKWSQQANNAVLCITHQTDWLRDFCSNWIDYNQPLAINKEIASPKTSSFPILSISNLSYAYSNKKIIRNFNANFEAGKCYAIIGISGKGKSTLGKIISGHLTNYEGSLKGIQFKSEPSNSDTETLNSWRNTFVYVPQNSFAIIQGENSFMEEMTWIYKSNKNTIPENRIWEDYCEKLNLNKTAIYRPLDSLSGGERQKLNILQFILHQPKLLVLDEPTASMDEFSKKWLIEFLVQIVQNLEMSIIFLTHDPILIQNANVKIEL